jgi:hypothetical protein
MHRSINYDRSLWIPDVDSLSKKILESEYDGNIARHIEQDKTVELCQIKFLIIRN